MAKHTAKSLFNLNMQNACDLLELYSGIEKLGSRLDASHLLRAVIVFSVSSIDSYFHDKVKYRAGKFDLHDMPPSLAKFQIPLEDLTRWEASSRKGNMFRSWLSDYYSIRPLQKKDDINKALKLVGIESVWATIEPNSKNLEKLFSEMESFIKRRNQIAHEGDRESSRKSGKKIRSINYSYAEECIKFFKELVDKIEHAFPN